MALSAQNITIKRVVWKLNFRFTNHFSYISLLFILKLNSYYYAILLYQFNKNNYMY